MDSNTAATGTVECQHDECGKAHVAEYHHDGQYGEGRVFIVYCTTRNDGLADFYTEEVVAPATPTAANLGIELAEADNLCVWCGEGDNDEQGAVRLWAGEYLHAGCAPNANDGTTATTTPRN